MVDNFVEHKWWADKNEYIHNVLNSNPNGLSDEEAQLRVKKYGFNSIKEKKKITAFEIFIRQFKSLTIYILLGAGAVSFALGDMVEFGVVVAIIFLISILGFVQEYRAERAMDALKNLTSKKAWVIRNNKKKEIDAKYLVPGDIISVERGHHIPADSKLIEASNFRVDESPLTGESNPIHKEPLVLPENTPLSERVNLIFTGTFVVNGNARAIVVGTGIDTEIGRVASLIDNVKEEKTPIQVKLDNLSKKISIVTLVIVGLMCIFGLIQKMEPLSLLMIVAAAAVSGIPESLPAVVTMTLARGVKIMAKKNAIIRKMPAVETLGAATVICSDKTGTLTQNKMTVEKIFVHDKIINVTGEGYNPLGEFHLNEKKFEPNSDPDISTIFKIGALCNNSSVTLKDNNEWELEGEPTEGALIVLAEKAGHKKEVFMNKHPRIRENPFDSDKKFMSTINVDGNEKVINVKGAPDIILKRCKFIQKAGKIKPLIPSERQIITEIYHAFAGEALRVLGFAYKILDETELKALPEDCEEDLIFVGFVAMRDPPRPDAKHSIMLCHQAGIKVVMITGDHKITAKTIGKELGIYDEIKHKILTGDELDSLDEEAFSHIVEKVTIYARTTPKHKLRIVTALQAKGHVVAMTGDGVNDAPALKKAQIGIAMGKGGTDVAREAAQMILTDDSFSTIVTAIKEGRTIYSNIKKFVYFMLTVNMSEVIILFVAVLMGMGSEQMPLTAIMILFVNLVTSDFPAMGLSMEESNDKIMKQKPRPVKEEILNEYTMLKIAQLVPLLTLGTISFFMWELIVKKGTIPEAQTVAFLTLVLFELFHIYNARSDEKSIFELGVFSNKYINIGVFVSFVCVLLGMYTSVGRQILGIVPVGPMEWIAVIIMSSSALFLMEIQKMIVELEIKERGLREPIIKLED